VLDAQLYAVDLIVNMFVDYFACKLVWRLFTDIGSRGSALRLARLTCRALNPREKLTPLPLDGTVNGNLPPYL